MKPQPVEVTAALLVRGIEHWSRTITTPIARLAQLFPEVFRLMVEGLARRCGWASVIPEQVLLDRYRKGGFAIQCHESAFGRNQQECKGMP